MRLQRRVAFIGYEVNRKLFGDEHAVGQTIRIRGIAFEVIGVMKDKAQLSNYFRPDKQCVVHPLHASASQSGISRGSTSWSARRSIRCREPKAD